MYFIVLVVRFDLILVFGSVFFGLFFVFVFVFSYITKTSNNKHTINTDTNVTKNKQANNTKTIYGICIILYIYPKTIQSACDQCLPVLCYKDKVGLGLSMVV